MCGKAYPSSSHPEWPRALGSSAHDLFLYDGQQACLALLSLALVGLGVGFGQQQSMRVPEGFEGVFCLALFLDESVERLDVKLCLLGVTVERPDEQGGAEAQQLIFLASDHEIKEGCDAIACSNEICHWKQNESFKIDQIV